MRSIPLNALPSHKLFCLPVCFNLSCYSIDYIFFYLFHYFYYICLFLDRMLRFNRVTSTAVNLRIRFLQQLASRSAGTSAAAVSLENQPTEVCYSIFIEITIY